MATPVVPPRPSRSIDKPASTTQPMAIGRGPKAEPLDRTQFARSPFNEPPDALRDAAPTPTNSLMPGQDMPERPPSVRLPSIGLEGEEYTTLSSLSGSQAPTLSRNVAEDLPLHQPTAAVPASTAKSRIQPVTLTQSNHPSTANLPVLPGPSFDDPHHLDPHKPHALRAQASFNHSSASLMTTGSADESGNDSGIHVPMYPDAGIVQAPSPTPSSLPGSAAFVSNFPSDSSPSRHHHRRTSSRQEFGPPGSYGMHGHAHEPRDRFERAWYQKHPEEREKELHRVYDPCHEPNGTAMSSDDLNRLVHSTSEVGIGMATSASAIGGPTEQIGYRTSEEYAQQLKHGPSHSSRRRLSHDQSVHTESPLRKTVSQGDAIDEMTRNAKPGLAVHIDPLARKLGKYSGNGYDPPTENLGPKGGNSKDRGGFVHEKGVGVPILASDELAKSPGVSIFMQPAVEPEQERQGDGSYHSGFGPDHPSYQSANAQSVGDKETVPVDRHRAMPEDEIQEFEPLFSEADDKNDLVRVVSRSRPEAYRNFPSSDIWEDTPNSLALTATVRTPEPEHTGLSKPDARAADPAHVFEHPGAESARKDHLHSTDRAHYLPDSAGELAKPKYNRGLASEVTRPGLARFPSSDVWEDTPDSSQLQAIVESTQTQLPVDSSKETAKDAAADSIPAIPRRPSTKTKPVVPARPAGHKPSVDGATLTKTPSREGTISTHVPSRAGSQDEGLSFPKAKPAVPARPTGSKISALKAGFMNDLNSRLQMGPTAPKKEPSESDSGAAEEQAPLADARKGRAKGPARRSKPTTETETETKTQSGAGTSSICSTRLVFALDGDGELSVASAAQQSAAADPVVASKSMTQAGKNVSLTDKACEPELLTMTSGDVVAEPEEINNQPDETADPPMELPAAK